MTKEYKEALAEVNEIMKFCDIDLVKKIPYRFKKFIEYNMDKNYKVKLDLDQSLNSQNLKKETKKILSFMYRDYICTNVERERIIKNQKDNIELIGREKYNPNNLFKNKKKMPIVESNKTKQLLVQGKSNIIKKIWIFIRNKLLKRKNI